MITIARLKIRGWKCFREETVLDLEPKAYAVFARKDGDAEASNWAGKSSLVEAVEAIKARIQTAIADPAVPTPAVLDPTPAAPKTS